jgi:hypothetical protein
VNDLIFFFFFGKNKVNSVVECRGMFCNEVYVNKQLSIVKDLNNLGHVIRLFEVTCNVKSDKKHQLVHLFID